MNFIKYVKENGLKRLLYVFYHYKLDLVIQKIILLFVKNKELKDIIIIESHNDFDCNGGALYNYLIENAYNQKYKIVWFLKNKIPKQLPKNVEAYKLLEPSIKKNYYICIAKYFTADCMVTNKWRDEQKSFYFTHGAIGLKNVAGKCHLPDSVDYILTPSEFYASIFAGQYELKYDPRRFVCLGYPSQDILFQPSSNEIRKITKNRFSKVVLWMPTFRKGGGYRRNDSTQELPMGIPIIKDEKSLSELNMWLEQRDMLLIIKIHPMQDLTNFKLHSASNIYVITGETVKEKGIDNYQLMKDVDALISDYSSAAYDFLMLDKPIGYDFSDLNSYINGLCVDNVDEYIAGVKIYNYDDMLYFLKMVSSETDPYSELRQKLKKKLYKYADKNNCKRIVEFMGL